MTNEEAALALQKYLSSVQLFNAQLGPDEDILLRWLAALKDPSLSAALAEHEEARSTYVNANASQLADDVVALTAILATLNS